MPYDKISSSVTESQISKSCWDFRSHLGHSPHSWSHISKISHLISYRIWISDHFFWLLSNASTLSEQHLCLYPGYNTTHIPCPLSFLPNPHPKIEDKFWNKILFFYVLFSKSKIIFLCEVPFPLHFLSSYFF